MIFSYFQVICPKKNVNYKNLEIYRKKLIKYIINNMFLNKILKIKLCK